MVYFLSQFVAKLIITATIALIIFVLVKSIITVWSADIDLGRLINPRAWAEEKIPYIPTREQNALYYDGVKFADVELDENQINKKDGLIFFKKIIFNQELYSIVKPTNVDGSPYTSGAPYLDTKEIDFREWKIKIENAEIGAAMSPGYVFGIYINAQFKILGSRNLF